MKFANIGKCAVEITRLETELGYPNPGNPKIFNIIKANARIEELEAELAERDKTKPAPKMAAPVGPAAVMAGDPPRRTVLMEIYRIVACHPVNTMSLTDEELLKLTNKTAAKNGVKLPWSDYALDAQKPGLETHLAGTRQGRVNSVLEYYVKSPEQTGTASTSAVSRPHLVKLASEVFSLDIHDPKKLDDGALMAAVERAAFQSHIRLPFMAADADLAGKYKRLPLGNSLGFAVRSMRQTRCDDILKLKLK